MSSTTTLPDFLNTYHYQCPNCKQINIQKGFNEVFFTWCAYCGKSLNYKIIVKDGTYI